MRDESRHGIRKPSGWLIPPALPGRGIAGGLVDDFDLLIAKYRWLLSQPSAQCARCGEDGYVWWAATSYREPVRAGCRLGLSQRLLHSLTAQRHVDGGLCMGDGGVDDRHRIVFGFDEHAGLG